MGVEDEIRNQNIRERRVNIKSLLGWEREEFVGVRTRRACWSGNSKNLLDWERKKFVGIGTGRVCWNGNRKS